MLTEYKDKEDIPIMGKILVIDDDEQLRIMLKQLFERNGYEVITASDGEKGIRLFNETGADLIITDLIMPEKEGLETITELRRTHPDLKIIAISGGGRVKPDDYLKLAESLGATRSFVKPVDRDVLLTAVNELIE